MFSGRIEGWTKLEPTVQKLWRLEGLIWTGILAVTVTIIDYFVNRSRSDYPLPPGLVGGLFGVVLIIWIQYLVGRSFDMYRYRLDEGELGVAKGVFWRSRRYISRARIQHVDVTAGPIAQALNLVSLSVFVGGQAMAAVSIPGLSVQEGERLRRALLPSEERPVAVPPIPEIPAGG